MLVTSPTCDVLVVEKEIDFGLKWLEENEARHLVVLGECQGSHPRLHDCTKDLESFKQIAWEFVFLEFGALEETDAIDQLLYYKNVVDLVASDFKYRGLDRLHNLLRNGKHFERARDGTKLFGAFKNIPAIICGAGPSLEKKIPYLKKMQQKALIFAGGSAVSALAHFEIHPHFLGFIDPHPPQKRVFSKKAPNVPTFFQNRVHPKVLSKTKGELLWMPGNENDFFETKHFDAGWNVATFLTNIATELGCNPIVHVGVDLMQKEETPYAADLKRTEGGKLIELENGMYSRSDWLMARDWIEDFKQIHPEVDWDGEIFEEKKKIDVESRIKSVPKGVMREFDRKKIKSEVKEIQSCIKQIIKLLEKHYPHPIHDPNLVQIEETIERTSVYQSFLTPVWNVWKHVLKRQIPKEAVEPYGLYVNKWMFLKGICDEI